MVSSQNQWTLAPEDCGASSNRFALVSNETNRVPSYGFLDSYPLVVYQIALALRDDFCFSFHSKWIVPLFSDGFRRGRHVILRVSSFGVLAYKTGHAPRRKSMQ